MATAPNHSRSIPSISMPVLKMRYLNCTERIPGFVVTVAGLLTSLWANCVLVVICIQDDYSSYQRGAEMYISKLIIQTSQLTHLIIVLTATAGLILGLKEKNRTLLPAWLVVKGLELIVFFVGTILLSVGRQNFIGIMPVALCFLLIGAYISMCVWDTYGKMNVTTRSSSFEEVNLDIASAQPLPKDPPSYDSFINQTNTRTNIRT